MSKLRDSKGKFLWLVMAAYIIIGAIGTYVTFPAYGSVVQSGMETEVTMEVTYGYGDTAKGDRYLPVNLHLENKAEAEFKGEVEILTQESSMEIYRYRYPVTIKGSSVVDNQYHIPLRIKGDQLYVTLKDEKGNVVNKKRLKLNISKDTAELMIGVLTDTPDQLEYLDGISMSYGALQTKVIHLGLGTFPEDAMSLDMLDIIMITNFDGGSLKPGQKKALDEWVTNGGALLFGTGKRGGETLGDFAEDLVQFPIPIPTMQSVNLGVEYAEKAPGDSVLELHCVDFTFNEGNELMSGDQLPLLTAVSMGRGKVGVASYDFVDIRDFCEAQPSYVEKIITALLGETKILQLAQLEYYGYSNQYWSVQGLVNSGSANRLPNVLLYTVVILMYVILIGPGLYLLLKKKGIQAHYLKLALLTSVCFTGIIYMMGYKTRFQSTFFTYATVLDASAQEVSEETYINVRTPNNNPYQVTISPQYTVRPMTKSYYYEMTAIPKFTGNEPYKVSLEKTEKGTFVDIQDSIAFSPKIFRLQKNSQNSQMGYFTSDITLFDGKISGTVTNHFPYPVENCALLLYGRIMILGNMEPGETKDVSGMKLLYAPMGYSYVVSQAVTGADQYDKVDVDNENYLIAQDRANLLSYYMYTLFESYTSQARIVAFSPMTSDKSFVGEGDYETDGVTMLTSLVEVNNTVDGQVYRMGSMKTPKTLSGSFQADYNIMMGVDPLILEYSLGNDLDIENVNFQWVSTEFTQNKKYSTLVSFAGKVYFYNYDTRNYDLMDITKSGYDKEALKSYLSPGNKLTVKYVYESGENYQWDVMLPMISVIGKEK